jgi:YVTN family beta-propeller protein
VIYDVVQRVPCSLLFAKLCRFKVRSWRNRVAALEGRDMSEYKWTIARNAAIAAVIALLIVVSSVYVTSRIALMVGPSGKATTSTSSKPSTSSTSQRYTATFSTVTPLVPISLGAHPIYIGYDQFNNELYVSLANSSVAVINGSTNSIVQMLQTGKDPNQILFVPSFGHEVFVANEGSHTITAISPKNNSIVATIRVDSSPSLMRFNMYNHEIYIACSDSIVAVNSSDVIVASFNYTGTGGLAYDNATHEILFSDTPDNVVRAISSQNQIVASISVGVEPQNLLFDPSNNDTYVTNIQSHTLSVIDLANQVVANIPVGSGAYYMVATPTTLYAANSQSGTLSAINASTNQVAANVSLGAGTEPTMSAYDETDGQIYVPILNDSYVLEVSSSNTIVGQIPTGQAPAQVFYDSIDYELYVANSGSNTLTVAANS